MVASVRFPFESVKITVMTVVPPAYIVLAVADTATLATVPPELPKPVVVPLPTLFCLLTSETLHPREITRAAPSKKTTVIEERIFKKCFLFPISDILVFAFSAGFVVATQGVKIIFPMRTGALIIVRSSPGVQRKIFL